ncbi:MAG: ABC transporter ATP-binding protein [Pseudomonadota bacterium]
MSEPIVRIRDLEVEFATEVGVTRALRSVSLDLARGRTTAIVGESGSGKSVTALAMLGLIDAPGRVTAGSIEFRSSAGAAYDVLRLDRRDPRLYQHRGGSVSMIFQEPMTALSPVHTIGNQVMEALLTHQAVDNETAQAEAIRLLERVGIAYAEARLSQYPFEFSGGMRQRVVIAMALINQPELIICDEPTTALDVTVQAEILTLLDELKAQYATSVMFITHDIGVVAQIADDVAVMYRGRVLETGTVREVLKDPLHPYTRGLLAALPGSATRGTRLQTIDDLVAPEELATDTPLRRLPSGRQVALPAEAPPIGQPGAST